MQNVTSDGMRSLYSGVKYGQLSLELNLDDLVEWNKRSATHPEDRDQPHPGPMDPFGIDPPPPMRSWMELETGKEMEMMNWGLEVSELGLPQTYQHSVDDEEDDDEGIPCTRCAMGAPPPGISVPKPVQQKVTERKQRRVEKKVRSQPPNPIPITLENSVL